MLVEKQGSDEESGDDEENVDPDESAVQTQKARVVQDHDDHGDGTQPFNVASKHDVVETGVDPVTFRFSGGRSAD